jgi:hypothetical protein
MQTGQYNGGAIPYHTAGIRGGGLALCAGDLSTACDLNTDNGNECAGIGDGSCLGPQTIMVLDSGFQIDAGDLSDTRTDAGTVGTAHRKVRVLESTNQFGAGGQGDTLGCDAPAQGGFTHGHVVAATAVGWGTDVTMDYGAGWNAFDQQNNPWNLDGVAPEGLVIAYDASVTPPNGSCSDPLVDGIFPGNLWSAGNFGSLGVSYNAGARIVNFSWGSNSNTYGANAKDIDDFIFTNPDAMVFVAAGNAGADNIPQGGDGVPDTLTLGTPATTKNGLAIGASRNANTVNSPESRAFFSSVGPVVGTTVNRIAPQLMAPGDEPGGGALGVSSEYTCRSQDNDNNNPVQCDIIAGVEGTSFASPAAAGAAMLVRDYFQQGFHPKALKNPSDTLSIGAAALKAILFASADYMTGANLSIGHRWNNEQGYGRIQLDQILPLEDWSRSPTGLLLLDPVSGRADINGLSGTATQGNTETGTFDVVNGDEELRIALAWVDFVTTAPNLRNNLELRLISPSGIEYRGNYFTDDNDLDGVPEPTEDCGGIGAEDVDVANAVIDDGQWSLPVCSLTKILGRNNLLGNFDNTNPQEAIFLSPDPQGDDFGQAGTGGNEGTCSLGSTMNAGGACNNNLDCRTVPSAVGTGQCINQDDYKQTEEGTWTIEVFHNVGTLSGPVDYALVVGGGVALGSTVRFDQGAYTCNERSTITVTELVETGSQGTDNPDANEVSSRVTIEVYDSNDVLVDSESGINFTNTSGFKFESDELQLTSNTARDPGNGALDVRNGDTLRVRYTDADVDTVGLPETVVRSNQSTVDCQVNIGFGSIVFAQFGQDSSTLVQGGCERNARNQFEFGFPDRYMDAGESVMFNFAFNSNESSDLTSVTAVLDCVNIDADSPVDCLPNGAGCEDGPMGNCGGGACDPLRENNSTCASSGWLTVLDSPKALGLLPAGSAISANFAIQMGGDGVGEPFEDTGGGQPTPTVEMVLRIAGSVSGKTSSGIAISRQRLNVDTITTLYSTDYPAGGTEVVDIGPGSVGNNDEIASNPITENNNFQSNDYRFETSVYAPLTTGGGNMNLLSPWNFDGNDGGMRVGLASATDETAADIFNIANWGEDKNFNNVEDGLCVGQADIACYNVGGNDARCAAGGTNCLSIEDNAGGTTFSKNWNTKGGCGWQTRATGECTGDPTRGCFDNADCAGVCVVNNNEIASTFEACTGACPQTKVCSAVIPNPNPSDPCDTDADCGGVPGTCNFVNQNCLGNAGTCGAIVGDHTGGVWHTGQIGTPNLACTGGAGSACANYKVIAGTGGILTWWELLTTPVMEKVDQTETDGLPSSTIEIVDMAWNSNANLRDSNAAYSWEIDTDLATLQPVDIFADTTALGFGVGAYGAIDIGTNPELTRGWNIFAPQCQCDVAPFGACTDLFQCSAGTCAVSNNPCHVVADCDAGTCSGGIDSCFSDGDCVSGLCDAGGDGTAFGEDCKTNADCEAIAGAGAVCTGSPEVCNMGGPLGTGPEGCTNAPNCDCSGGTSVNGSLGNSRVGDAGCFFEGAISNANLADLGPAGPLDDDIDNDGDAAIDEFVQDDGPYRNHDLVAFNGPDMRFFTLEDIYGDTGNSFQAGLGFVAFEGTAGSQAQQSYGMAVDDLVVKWREFTFDSDVTDCATTGSCAVIELAASNVFDGQTVLTVTVLDAVPDPFNDCDLDGSTDGTNDCDNDATPDVVIKATSEADLAGEIVFLNSVGGASYRGFVTISSLGDGPGTLFVAQEGSDNPTVTVTYLDNDIDPGPAVEVCPNDVDVAKHGLIQATSGVFLGTVCEVTVVGTEIMDNGDGDEFVDTEETVDMQVCLINNCGADLTNCTGRLFSNSPNVDCILDSVIDVGDLLDGGGIQCVTDPFRWKMANVNRVSTDDIFTASFSFTMSCDQIDALSVSQEFALSLDLDLNDLGQTPSVWLEDFESGTLGDFFAENLDSGIPGNSNTEGLFNAQGYRCQYSDPDFPNSSSYGADTAADCFPGQTLAQSVQTWWSIDGAGAGAPDGGRAHSGVNSLYYGAYVPADSDFTTPMAVIESAALTQPLNLGIGSPELSFWHQVSLMDGRFVAIAANRSADRGVVQYKTVGNGGADTSDWTNLQAFQNTYDTQAYDFFFNCLFDPIDDGTTEDDYFDPTDPNRRLGPSSTCHPTFAYSCLGDTNDPFQVENICNAPAPSAGQTQPEAGSLGVGTWVETKVDLDSVKGRRIKLRYLVTSLKASAETHDIQFGTVNPGEWDNGWWIDDVSVSETLALPALLLVDNNTVRSCAGDGSVGCLVDQDCVDAGTTGPCGGSAPQCGAVCTSVTASIETTPDLTGDALNENLAAPGQPIEINASGSSGTCQDGALQYRFTKDGSEVLREWSENAVIIDVPQALGSSYLVQVRCSTDTSCSSSAVVNVTATCPASGNLGGLFESISASTKTSWSWATPQDYQVWSGALSGVSSYAGSSSTGSGNSFSDLTVPSSGSGLYYVVRSAGEFCNEVGLWSSGGAGESAAREPSLP